jgi:hypothetical protein
MEKQNGKCSEKIEEKGKAIRNEESSKPTA